MSPSASLAQRLAARREEFARKAKPEWLETMHRATEDLRRAGAAEWGPGIGAPAPDFVLPRAGGGSLRLSEVRAAGPVILSFYRGRW